MKISNRLVKPLCLCKSRKIAERCGNFLSGRIIDVGAGRCYIAKELKSKYSKDITCVDIDDLNETDMKLAVYDGKKLPHRNNSFDTALLVYVLHHCENPVETLKDVARVVKKGGKIIIFEDFGFILFTHALDWLSNKMHNVDAPLHFKKYNEWVSLFKDLNLEIIDIRHGVERQVFYPFAEHKMFVLKVKK